MLVKQLYHRLIRFSEQLSVQIAVRVSISLCIGFIVFTFLYVFEVEFLSSVLPPLLGYLIIVLISVSSAFASLFFLIRNHVNGISDCSRFAQSLSDGDGAILTINTDAREVGALVGALNAASCKINYQSQVLQRHNALLKRSQALAKVWIWEYDVRTKKLTIPDSLRNALGLPGSAHISLKSVFRRIHKEDLHRVIRGLRYASMGKQSISSDTFRVGGSGSSQVIIFGSAEVDLDRDGSVSSFFGIAQDVTEAERSRSLRKRVEHLSQINKAKSDFISIVSHEVRTPLTSIKSFSEILLDSIDELDKETTQQYVEIIDSESERLSGLLNDLLDAQRLESGHMTFRDCEVDLNDVISDCIILSRASASQKGVKLSFTQTSTPSIVFADPVKVRQIVTNLLSNAIKFTNEGEISVSISHPDHPIKVAIVDPVPASARRIGRCFGQFGCEVVSFADGKDALYCILGEGFDSDIVVFDVSVPDLDHVLALRQIRDRFPSLPVIFTKESSESLSSDLCISDNLLVIKDTGDEALKNQIHEAVLASAGYSFSSDFAQVCVKDTGCGIPSEDLCRVFDRFYRTAYSSEIARGTGLGLSICKQYIEHYKGKIWAESVIGHGSAFCFLLPLRKPERRKLGEILVDSGYLTEEQLQNALKLQ